MSKKILEEKEDIVYPREIFTLYNIDCHKFWDFIDIFPDGSAM